MAQVFPLKVPSKLADLLPFGPPLPHLAFSPSLVSSTTHAAVVPLVLFFLHHPIPSLPASEQDCTKYNKKKSLSSFPIALSPLLHRCPSPLIHIQVFSGRLHQYWLNQFTRVFTVCQAKGGRPQRGCAGGSSSSEGAHLP